MLAPSNVDEGDEHEHIRVVTRLTVQAQIFIIGRCWFKILAIKNADFEPLESFEQKVTMMGRASLVLRKMSSSFKLAEKQASFQKKKSRPAKR